MFKRLGGWWVLVALIALLTVCFARLAAAPGSLLVDGERPSADDLQRPYDRVVGNDLTRLFLPHHLRIAHEVSQRGRFAFWDWFGFGGRPRVGNPQAGLWYPPVWLVWWSGSPAALGWLTVAHLFWGGLGTYLLVRTLGLGRWPATVAAGCYQAAPYLLAQAFEGHAPHLWAASWYPWAFSAAVLMRRGDWRGTFALPPILALALLAGHPQEWYYLVFTLGIWAVSDVVIAFHTNMSLSNSRRDATKGDQFAADAKVTLARPAAPWASEWASPGNGPGVMGNGAAPMASQSPDGHVIRSDRPAPASPRLPVPADALKAEALTSHLTSTAVASERASHSQESAASMPVARQERRVGSRFASETKEMHEAAPEPSAWHGLVRWAGVFAVALGLAAVELVPDMKAREWMPLNGLSLNNASHYHPNALNLVQLLDPFALGGPAEHFGHDNYWETVCSIGLVPLVLAVIAVARSPRRRLARGWALLVLLAIAFAAGRRLGLFAVLFEVVPGMNQFRVPARSLFLASLGAAVLAGLGLEVIGLACARAVTDWPACARRFRRVVTILLLGLGIGQVIAWRVEASRAHRPDPAQLLVRGLHHAGLSERSRFALGAARIVQEPVFWVALAGTTMGLFWLARRPGEGRRVSVALGVLALVELGSYGHALIKTAPAGQFLGIDPVSESLARVSPPGSFRIRARDAFYSDLRAARHGFEKTNVNDFFQVRHAADLYENLYPIFVEAVPEDPRYPEAAAQARRRRFLSQHVLDRMSVALLVTDHPEPGARWPVVESGSWDGTPYLVYRNPTALPRAYVVPRAEKAPADASALNLLPAIDPQSAVLMVSDPLGPETGARQPFTPAEYEASDPDRVVVRVTTRAPGLLVVADTWMPGWSALVDGKPAPILRGNHAQRVIAVAQPGAHTIVMRYQPPGLAIGSAITAASGLVWLLALAAASLTSERKSLRPSSRQLSTLSNRNAVTPIGT
ncbi:MAG TPA: hypothetical protein VGZ22_02875 [Isosphaeraceae bacterium]|jgi:hypothetical protein|nr:hypothetical protein [Isosphaeraceae bacterium]